VTLEEEWEIFLDEEGYAGLEELTMFRIVSMCSVL